MREDVWQPLIHFPVHAYGHVTGQVVFDFDGDGWTDLLLFPSTFNEGYELPGTALTLSGESVVDVTAGVMPHFTTGFVKDWIVTDLTNDGRADLFLVDHGLELPPELGGYQHGHNRVLSAADGKLAFSGSFPDMGRAFYHSAAVGNFTSSHPEIVIQRFDETSISLLTWSNGMYADADIGATFSNYAYSPGAVATVKAAHGQNDLLALGTYVVPDIATGNKALSLWNFSSGAPFKVADWQLPSRLDHPSQGVFKIITADFRGVGRDDMILLTESVELGATYSRSWVYLTYDESEGFRDDTLKVFGTYEAPTNLNNLVVADVNTDGHLDLVGFTFDADYAATNRQVLVNDGKGQFDWMDTRPYSDDSILIPRLAQSNSGEFSDLQGFFKLSYSGANTASIEFQPLSYGITTVPDYAASAALGMRGFDVSFYLGNNADVAQAGVDAYGHYLNHGWREGRDPNDYFDVEWYLEAYSDVRDANMNPLEHYYSHGWLEGRKPSAEFDGNSYLAAHPDVARAGMNPLDHYLAFGMAEGRTLE